MMARLNRWLVLVLLLVCAGGAPAEKVADLPLPHSYVNDFAGVLSPGTRAEIEGICRQLHDKADADVAVVTIKTLDDGESVDEFTSELEEKWKLGKKGEDRSAIYLLVLNPHKLRVETGYGLEGILPDAKVGRILDQAVPAAQAGNYDQAMLVGTEGLANVIAADKGVTLTAPVAQPQYHWQQTQTAPVRHGGVGQLVVAGIVVVILIVLVLTGNLGWALVLLMNILGNGGGGGGGGDGEGGGFGGMGGGASGGGGASRDF